MSVSRVASTPRSAITVTVASSSAACSESVRRGRGLTARSYFPSRRCCIMVMRLPSEGELMTAAQTAPPLPSPPHAGDTPATMPAWWYDDAQHDRAERASIFRRTWQVAGLSRDVAQPGSYLAADLAGMPVLVTRDADGELRAFANVCPHRGMLLASGCGDAKLIQCPNHSWVFRLDGTLRSAPRSER